jgi:hypothetical protein
MATIEEEVKEYVDNLIDLVELKFRLEEQVWEYRKWETGVDSFANTVIAAQKASCL